MPEGRSVTIVRHNVLAKSANSASGENARRRVTHYNLVRSIERVGAWNGMAMYFDRQRCTPQCAALVQQPDGGRIIAAAFTHADARTGAARR